MAAPVTIALDAMGGDHGPSVVLAGAAISLVRHPDTRFLLVGDAARIDAELKHHPALAAKSEVLHTDVAVAMDAKPSQALRQGRWKSSMWLALDAVKKGDADAAVSAGNTGALMAMAKFNLHTMPGIERPAIAGLWPTIKGDTVMLDMGASIGAEADHLVDLAVMGTAMARVLFDLDRPTVGLLNIGVEDVKGLESVREAGKFLREADLPFLDYVGFVEADMIGQGAADVIVTEGFAGNIAIKTAEGTAKQITSLLRSAMSRTWRARLGYLLARDAFMTLRDKLDPRKANGGVFLGLNGIVIKSHGGTDAEGFAAAVDVGYDMVHYELLNKIRDMLLRHAREEAGTKVGGAAS